MNAHCLALSQKAESDLALGKGKMVETHMGQSVKINKGGRKGRNKGRKITKANRRGGKEGSS